MEQLRGVLNLKGYRIMGRVSEDEDVEKPLTSVDSNAPYSDGDGRPYVQTTCECCQKTASRQRAILRVSLTTLLLVVLATAPLLYRHLRPLTPLHKPYSENFPLVPADFIIDDNWLPTSGQDPYDSAWWPNAERGFAHNGTSNGAIQDPTENIWASVGNPYIMLHKSDPLWVPHGIELQQTGPADAWMSDYNAFITNHGHAMHCLGVIRHRLNMAVERQWVGNDDGDMKHANSHCVDVLRRTLACSPNLYMTGIIDTNFWNSRTANNLNMCRAGVEEWLRERWVPRNVSFVNPPSEDELFGTLRTGVE